MCMKYLNLFLFLFSLIISAQTIDLTIVDYSSNLPLENADVYFKNSSKNFISDHKGRLTIDLSDIHSHDELIVSKKEYHSIQIAVESINADLMVKLERIDEIDLNEAIVTNVTLDDVLRKVIENYPQNYNVDQYYLLVDLKQNIKIDTLYENLLNFNVQLKFNNGKVKAKSSGIIKNRVEDGVAPIQVSFDQSDYFKHLYLLEGIKILREKYRKNHYSFSELKRTEYAGKKMYEVFIENGEHDKNYLLIDRDSYSIVEYLYIIRNTISTNKNTPLSRNGIVSFKYRPYREGWVLKESEVNFKMQLDHQKYKNLQVDFYHKITTSNFSEKPFQYFNKNIDLNQNLHDQF